MQYDLFISYSRKDNSIGRVTELKEQIEADYLAFANEELKCFFDMSDISGMEDWKHRLLQGLKDSHMLLLILSPNYLASPYCEWEVVEYLKYEYSRAVQGEGVAQIYFMEIPRLNEPEFKEKAKEWVEKLSGRERFDLRPWYVEGVDSLKNSEVKKRLEELKSSLHKCIARMRRIANVPGNLPAPNARFVGRQYEMKMLHESVGLGKFGVLTAVHGMGGLGKTAIALQYAYAYADFYPGGRWQIGCSKATNLAGVLKKLDLDLKVTFTEDEKKDDIQGAKRILNELESLAWKGAEARSGKNNPPKPAVLLLLDNVDQAELIQFPNSELVSGKEWLKILVTTRLGQKELGADETRQSLIAIDELPFDDAISLFESYQLGGRFNTQDEKNKAGEIVKLLGGFTLAIEVAALYLYERKGHISCADFLELLKREGELAGIEMAGAKTNTSINHIKLISATLAPTLEILSPVERLILSYCSFLPPDSIPLPWLRGLVIKEYPELGKDSEAGHDDSWISTINHLLSLRLIQIIELNVDGLSPPIVRMHRLVQELVEERIKDWKEQIITNLVDFVKARADYFWDNWVKKETRWEINTIKLCSFLWMGKGIGGSTDIANQIHLALCQLGYISEAKELLMQALEINEQFYQSNHPKLAIIYSNLGLIDQDLGNLKEAKELLKKALAINEQSYETNHPTLAVNYSNLCSIERDLGNLKEAKGLIKKAIAINEQYHESKQTTLAISYSILGLIEQTLGNLKEAKELLKKALVINEQCYESNHPALAVSYSNLGLIEKELGNLKEAKKFLINSIAIDDQCYEPNHPILAVRYSNLGLIEQDLGNLKVAKELLQKALAINEQCYKPKHPILAVSYSNLGLIEQDLGNLKIAKELVKKAIAINQQCYEPKHPILAVNYSNLGLIEQDLGNLKVAKELLKKALAIDEQCYEPNNPTLAIRYSNLGLIEKVLGNPKEAKGLLKKALAINEQCYEPKHPTRAVSYSNLGLVEKDLGNLKEAKELLKKALAINEQCYELNHPKLAISYSNLALVEKDLGNLKGAKHLLKKAIAIDEQSYEPDHPKLALRYSNLGIVELALGNLKEAEILFKKAKAIRDK